MADGDANYSPDIAQNLREILDSDRFVTECFNRRSLTISQALCLLWHNQDSGEVPNVTDVALVDLCVLRKIDFEDIPVTCMSGCKVQEHGCQSK